MYEIAKRLKDFDSSIFQDAFHRQRTLKNPVNLSIGLPEGPMPQFIKDAGIRAIRQNRTEYTPANGILPLRALITKKLLRDNKIEIDESAVTTVPGLTTGMLLIYLATINPGDEVIMMDPSYPSYIHLAPLAGATVKQVPTLPNFQLDFAAIQKNISEKTRLLIVNTPNNPTGAVYPKKDLVKLAGIAKKHNITIVSDEMYESFIYEGEHFSIGSIYPNTITMNGFSKSYAMTGWRLGYIAGPPEIINAINQLQQYAVFCSSSIAQHAAIEALSQPIPPRDSYVKKRRLVIDKLTQAGYDIQGSNGAYYTFFQVPQGKTDMDFINQAADHNLLLLPGRAFSKQETFARISYGGTIEEVEKGLDIISKITKQS